MEFVINSLKEPKRLATFLSALFLFAFISFPGVLGFKFIVCKLGYVGIKVLTFLIETVAWILIIYSFSNFLFKVQKEEYLQYFLFSAMFLMITISYTLLRQAKDVVLAGKFIAGMDLKTLLLPAAKLVVLPAGVLYQWLYYGKVAKGKPISSLFTISSVPILIYMILYFFVLKDNAIIVPSDAVIMKLVNLFKSFHLGWFENLFYLLKFWPNVLFYVFAEIYSVTVLSSAFWQIVNSQMDKEKCKRMVPSILFLGQFATLFAGYFNSIFAYLGSSPTWIASKNTLLVELGGEFLKRYGALKGLEKESTNFFNSLAQGGISTLQELRNLEPDKVMKVIKFTAITDFVNKHSDLVISKKILVLSKVSENIYFKWVMITIIISSFLLLGINYFFFSSGVGTDLVAQKKVKETGTLDKMQFNHWLIIVMTIFYNFTICFIDQFWKLSIYTVHGKDNYADFTGQFYIFQSRCAMIMTVFGSSLFAQYCPWILYSLIVPSLTLLGSLAIFGFPFFAGLSTGKVVIGNAICKIGAYVIALLKATKYSAYDLSESRYLTLQDKGIQSAIKVTQGSYSRSSRSIASLVLNSLNLGMFSLGLMFVINAVMGLSWISSVFILNKEVTEKDIKTTLKSNKNI